MENSFSMFLFQDQTKYIQDVKHTRGALLSLKLLMIIFLIFVIYGFAELFHFSTKMSNTIKNSHHQ